ncbi:MAG: hypothetical protein Q7R90_00425 [bacterium]|nr:hypothetical protein [bacterium]
MALEDSKLTPAQMRLRAQDALARAKLKEIVERPSAKPKNSDTEKDRDIRKVMKDDRMRGTSTSGETKPGLDYYDNRRDKDGTGDASRPPYAGKFGKSGYDQERE